VRNARWRRSQKKICTDYLVAAVLALVERYKNACSCALLLFSTTHFLGNSLKKKLQLSTCLFSSFLRSKNVLAPSRWLGTSSSPRSRRFEIVWYGCYGSRKTGSSNLLLFPGRSKSLSIYRKSRCPLSGLRSSECNRGKHMGNLVWI
jgi:hypothetical protein